MGNSDEEFWGGKKKKLWPPYVSPKMSLEPQTSSTTVFHSDTCVQNCSRLVLRHAPSTSTTPSVLEVGTATAVTNKCLCVVHCASRHNFGSSRDISTLTHLTTHVAENACFQTPPKTVLSKCSQPQCPGVREHSHGNISVVFFCS